MKNLKKIAILADSIYCATLIDETGRYYYTAKDYHEQISAETAVEIYDLSSFGLNTEKARNKFNGYIDSLTEDTKPDFFLIALGGNDCDRNWKAIAANPENIFGSKVDPERYLENYRYFLDKIREKSIIPVFCSLAPIDSNNFWNFICKLADGNQIMKWLRNKQKLYAWQEYYNYILVKLANEENILLCDIREAFLSSMDFEKYINIDGIHLTKAGYDKLFSVLIDFLNTL